MSDVLLCLSAGLVAGVGLVLVAFADLADWKTLRRDIGHREPEALVTIVLFLAALLAISGLVARAAGAQGWPCDSDAQCDSGERCVLQPAVGFCEPSPPPKDCVSDRVCAAGDWACLRVSAELESDPELRECALQWIDAERAKRGGGE